LSSKKRRFFALIGRDSFAALALASLCFQMFAEAEDVDVLLEMIRSTALTDYISLDGETQPLQLMNPA
jgi:hypothetical protein